MKKIMTSACAVAALVMSAGAAQAAGFQLSEYTTTGLGRAFAGAGIMGDDFSAIGFNPAGMQMNKTSGGQVGITSVTLDFDYKGSVTNPLTGARSGSDQNTTTRALPNIFAQYKVNDKTTVGLGVYVPYGLATDYPRGWFGDAHARLSQLSSTNISPAISYQINQYLGIGAALNIQYTTAKIGNTVESGGMYFPDSNAKLEGDDIGFGYTLGFTVTPNEKTRFGVSYRSKIKQKLKGDMTVSGIAMGGVPIPGMNGTTDVTAKVTTPEVLIFSGAYDLNRCFTLSAIAKWTRWSQFERLDIIDRTTGKNKSGTFENWKNTWYYGAGVDYHMTKKWTLRAGLGYDETVIKSPAYRTPRIPDGRRVLASLGASYAWKNWQFDVGYMHIFMHGGRANQVSDQSGEKIDIKYSAHAELASFNVQYKF